MSLPQLGDSTLGTLEPGLVLIANDHEWTARSVETILVANGHEVVRAHTGREALALATRRRPDLFILDHQLPDLSGLEVCATLRADPLFGASTPVIVTTAGPSGRQQRLAAHAAGAWEFYGQPLDGEALLLKVQVFLAARQESLRHALSGLLDPETGLYNRQGLERRRAELAATQHREARPLCRIAVQLGGESPPGARAVVAETLQAVPRRHDVKGRESPDTFMVLALADRDGGYRLVERLETAFAGAGLTPDAVRVTLDEVVAAPAT